jgi:hypothetical protein
MLRLTGRIVSVKLPWEVDSKMIDGSIMLMAHMPLPLNAGEGEVLHHWISYSTYGRPRLRSAHISIMPVERSCTF